MFYFGELTALLICWLFYCEFYWALERQVLKACSRQYIDKRCRSFSDRLFFTPVSGKAKLGILYYLNRILVYYLSLLTAIHLLFGWSDAVQGVVRTFTAFTVTGLGILAITRTLSGTESLCADMHVTSKRIILILKILSLLSIVILVIAYHYFTWIYIG